MAGLRTVQCACGGWITADPRDPTDEVRRHQGGRQHIEWRGVRYHRCAGVEDATCMVSIPLERRLCRFCLGTLRLLAERRLATA